MATHIRKSYERNVWTAIAIGFLIDVAVIFVVLIAFFPQVQVPLIWAFGLRLGLEIVASLYGLYVFAKRFLWFQLFERKERIELSVREFEDVGLPDPEPYYDDADEYLARAARDETLGTEARFNAAFMLGVLFSQRQFGPKREALITNIVVEEALKRMPAKKH